MKQKIIIAFFILLTMSVGSTQALADASIDNGIAYLKAQQATSGQITGGSTGDATPWAAIALSANGIDPTTVKNGSNSLIDYLQANEPTAASPATDWEKYILAIVASGQNPYNFGGVNFVSTLESSTYYHDNQIGDTTSVTDDWFGVMALIASGVDKTNPTITDALAFILKNQNTDGGFGYATGAGSDGNDTAAAIQALTAAQSYGVTNANLSNAITNAKTYLLTTQDASGGFLYDTNAWTTAPDSDSTTWGLMALNALGMQSATQSAAAKSWLLSQQGADGGFQACQYNPPDYACTMASNSTTTSHALIGLAGKDWILKIFDASSLTPTPTTSLTPTATPTPSSSDQTGTQSEPTPTPTPTPTDTPASSTPTPTMTPTPTPTIVPTTTPTPSDTQQATTTTDTPTPDSTNGFLGQTDATHTPAQEVLGANETKTANSTSLMQLILLFSFLGLGFVSFGLYGFKKFKGI